MSSELKGEIKKNISDRKANRHRRHRINYDKKEMETGWAYYEGISRQRDENNYRVISQSEEER